MRIALDWFIDFAHTFPGLTASIVSLLVLLPMILEMFDFVNRLLAHIK